MFTSQSSKQQAFSFRFVLFVRLSLACLTKTDSLLMRVIKRVIKSAIIALLYIKNAHSFSNCRGSQSISRHAHMCVRTTVSHLLKASLVTDNFFHQTLDLRIRFVHAYVPIVRLDRAKSEQQQPSHIIESGLEQAGKPTGQGRAGHTHAGTQASQRAGGPADRQTRQTGQTRQVTRRSVRRRLLTYR